MSSWLNLMQVIVPDHQRLRRTRVPVAVGQSRCARGADRLSRTKGKRGTNELFAHTIGRIDFIDGIVRIELANLVPNDGAAASIVPQHVLHMPLSGFMRGTVTLENFIRELVKRGILPTPAEVRQAAAPAGILAATGSPNFG